MVPTLATFRDLAAKHGWPEEILLHPDDWSVLVALLAPPLGENGWCKLGGTVFRCYASTAHINLSANRVIDRGGS